MRTKEAYIEYHKAKRQNIKDNANKYKHDPYLYKNILLRRLLDFRKQTEGILNK